MTDRQRQWFGLMIRTVLLVLSLVFIGLGFDLGSDLPQIFPLVLVVMSIYFLVLAVV